MDFDVGIYWDALRSSEFLHGAFLTVALALASQVAATILGFFLALMRTSRSAPVRVVSGVYAWVFRAIPTLLILLFIWNALPQLIPALTEDWFTPFLAGFIGLSVAEAAYMAEIIRSALLSVDPEQRLAAKALGMTPAQSMRKVILPQVIRIAIPPTGNELITMLKFTSLTSVISLQELLTVSQQNIAATFRYAEFYAAAATYYLVIVSILMVLQMRLERRYEWRTREAGRRRAFSRRRNAPGMGAAGAG
jgi:His/Glu/Gln/Arg/opine family amino acid ABC transporter permease subunit